MPLDRRAFVTTLAAACLLPQTTQARAGVDPALVARASAYFNGIRGLSGIFSQRNHRGQLAGGTLYLLRPGRALFVYDEPSTLEIVADGRALAIRDTRTQRQEILSLSQTPFRFFLDRDIDLMQAMNVTAAYRAGNEVVVEFEDRSTFGGRSLITLVFDHELTTLRQWIVIDPQGHETSVTLGGLRRHDSLDESLFRISYEQMMFDRHQSNN